MKILITGGTSGIGRSVAIELGRKGYSIDVVGGFSEQKGILLKEEFESLVGSVRFFPVDLSSVESVKSFAQSYLQENNNLDVLFLNAGKYVKDPEYDKNGLDKGFVVNYLHKFMLLVLLNPLLKESNGRVVINGSANFSRKLQLEKDYFAKNYSPMSGMMQSTYANAHLTYWINKVFDSGVIVQSVNPGFVNTNMMKTSNLVMRWFNSIFGVTPEVAAKRITPVIEGKIFSTQDAIYVDKGKIREFKSGVTSQKEQFIKLWHNSLSVADIENPSWTKCD